ncbi:MAG: hypothetical protein V7636_2864, partial [Actinomycetota bacterium]
MAGVPDDANRTFREDGAILA